MLIPLSASLRRDWLGNRAKNFRAHNDVRQIAFGILFFSSIVLVIVYVVAPEQIAWAALPVPTGWRWLGVGLGLVCIFLLLWAHRALGANLAAQGVIKAKQWLVTAGPSQWVRHLSIP